MVTLSPRKLIHIHSRLWIGALLALVAVQVHADDTALSARLRDSLEAIRARAHLPAMGAAIVGMDGIRAIAVTGVRKAGTTTAATINDKWHLGSDTKAFTATMIAALVDAGELKWTTTIGDAFPELRDSLPPPVAAITLVQLLSHHAGLPHDINWRALSQHGTLVEQRVAAVRMLAHTPLIAKPGAEANYSNCGFVIAAAMAESVTRATWETLVRKGVLDPLGIRSAGFGGAGTPGLVDQPWPHREDGTPNETNGPAADNPAVMAPAGGLHCSLPDWAAFVRDQLRGESSDSALLPRKSYTALHTPPCGGDEALGWKLVNRSWAGGTALTHSGTNTLNYSIAWIAPKKHIALLVCTNQGGTKAATACDEALANMVTMVGLK